VSAGEALPDATRQMFKQATGVEIIDGIGSTEMIHCFISHTPERVRRGATGYAVPGYRAAILNDNLEFCKPGEIGRLAVKGPTGCRYLADPRQSEYVQNGWNITGDAYLMDEDGYFFYQARTDDMIISAGYNIAGPEVEGALLTHPAVAECGVVGAPDPERGTIVKAFVVLKKGIFFRIRNGEDTSRPREEIHCTVQIPSRHRVHRHLAAHRNRKSAALQIEDSTMKILQPPAGRAPRASPTASPRAASSSSSPARSAGPANANGKRAISPGNSGRQ
jgi:acyl-coenzyme A synthetase/AMP-(fatty) acid ligase